jgi:hypothetical protein
MKVKATHEVMVRLPCCRRLQQGPFNLGFRDVCDQQRRNRAYNLVLNREYIVELSVVPLSPTMRAGLCVNQLRSNAHVITAPAELLQHVTDLNSRRRTSVTFLYRNDEPGDTNSSEKRDISVMMSSVPAAEIVVQTARFTMAARRSRADRLVEHRLWRSKKSTSTCRRPLNRGLPYRVNRTDIHAPGPSL